MVPSALKVISLKWCRPGRTHIRFIADYGLYKRRGTLIYNTINGKFLTHTSDVNLILMIYKHIQTNNNYSSI